MPKPKDPRDLNFAGAASFHRNKALHSLACVQATETLATEKEKQRLHRSTRGGEMRKVGRYMECVSPEI